MILAFLLLLAATTQDPEIDCENAMAQQELNICAYRDYEQADAALNAQWKLTEAAMKAQDAGLDRSYDKRPGYYDTLLAAQKAWLIYRDRHCEAEGYAMRGGSAEPMVNSGCLATLTRARTAELQALIVNY